MTNEPRITHVYVWSNDQVMVFDQFGKQMPEFQDQSHIAIPKIQATGFTGPFHHAVWPGDLGPYEKNDLECYDNGS